MVCSLFPLLGCVCAEMSEEDLRVFLIDAAKIDFHACVGASLKKKLLRYYLQVGFLASGQWSD